MQLKFKNIPQFTSLLSSIVGRTARTAPSSLRSLALTICIVRISTSMNFVDDVVEKATISRSFIGHKDRAFDVRYSADDYNMISGSEDGTSKVWDVKTGKCIKTLVHNKAAEVLRATFLSNPHSGLCTCGSDGNAVLWTDQEGSGNMQRAHVFEHGKDAQIYVCEVSNQAQSNMMVAAENFLVVWDVNSLQQASLHTFGDTDDTGPSFGGHRNPENNVFVFDAKMNPVDNSIIGVALSDSSIRMLDLRCSPEQSISPFLSKPVSSQITNIGHATSVSLTWTYISIVTGLTSMPFVRYS